MQFPSESSLHLQHRAPALQLPSPDYDLVVQSWTCADVLAGLVSIGEQLTLQHITGFSFVVDPRSGDHIEIGGE